MEFLFTLFHDFLWQPLLNALLFFYTGLPWQDFGIAIILLTLVIRIALFPLTLKAARSQKALMELQPKLKEVQEKHKKNKQRQTQAIMALYQEHHINPLSGCFPVLLQLPILIALYRVFLLFRDMEEFRGVIQESLYSFIAQPEVMNPYFLGVLHLGDRSIVVALLAGGSQFLLSRLMTAKKKKGEDPKKAPQKQDFAQTLSWQMTYIFPVVTVFFALNFPAGLALYWVATTIFSIGQQFLVNRLTATSGLKA